MAASLNNLALLYVNQGQSAKAAPLYKRALAINEKVLGPDHPDVAISLNNLAGLFDTQGQYVEAEPLYRRALRIKENAFGLDHSSVALSVNNLAGLYRNQGQYAQAESLFRRALAIWEKTLGPDHFNVALGLNNLAGLYDTQGQYVQAEPLYKRALAVNENALGPIHPSVALNLSNLASLYQTQGQYAQAELLHGRALMIWEKVLGAEHPTVALSLNNLAALYFAQGRYTQAELLYKRALRINEKAFGADHPDMAAPLNNLAELFRAQGQYAQAEQLHKRALVIKERVLGPFHPDVAVALSNLAVLYRTQGQDAAATPLVRRATEIFAKRASLGESSGARFEQHIRQRRFIDHLSLLIQLQKTVGYDITAEATQVIQLARASDTSAAVAQMATRFSSGNSELAQLIRNRQDLRARLDALDKRLLDQFGKAAAQRQPALEQGLRDDIARTNTEFDALSATLVERFPQYAELASAQPLALAEAQKLLKPDEALLAWVFGKDEGFLLAVRAGQAALVRLPLPLQRLRDDIATLRRSLDVQNLRPFPAELAHRLYRDLIGPAEGLIGDAKHIFVVPDGPLESLPLAVLLTAPPVDARDGLVAPEALRDAPWLTRKWAISTLPSISSLKALRVFAKASGATRPFLGIGDPLLDDHPQNTRGAGAASKPGAASPNAPASSAMPATPAAPRTGIALATLFRGATADVRAVGALPSLPETAGELQAMAASLGAGSDALVLRAAATETEVKRMTLSNNRVVAFATHGAMAGEMKGLAEPALVLTPPAEPTELDDGLLTASEIAQLKLDADWVILSACNTAAGDGTPGAEGLSGLAKAFIYAGARTLLVSHWPVASEPTVALTTRMLSESAKPGVGRAEAHRRAMLAYLADPANLQITHPAYWAGFAVIGEGGVVGR